MKAVGQNPKTQVVVPVSGIVVVAIGAAHVIIIVVERAAATRLS